MPTTPTIFVFWDGSPTIQSYDTILDTTSYGPNNSLQQVYVGNSVTEIAPQCFSSTNAGNSIYLLAFHPDGQLQTIGESAFEGQQNLALWNKNNQVVLPNSLTTIGARAFFDCGGILNLWFGNNVSSIGDSAFSLPYNYPCNIRSMVFRNQNNLLTVGASVFGTSFYALQSVTYYNTANQAGLSVASSTLYNAYWSSNTVVKNYYASAAPTLSLFRFVDGTFSVSTDVTLDTNSYDSNNSQQMQSAVVGNIVEAIGLGCFAGTTSLTGITFRAGSRLQSLGEGAFDGSSLPNIQIPLTVVDIGNTAFNGCQNLTQVFIPSAVKRLGDYAFGSIQNDFVVTFDANSQLETIGYGCFYNSYLTSFAVPYSVKTILGEAFSGCTKMSITFPNPSLLESIGYAAFYGCSFTQLTLPSLAAISDLCFINCSNLTALYFTNTNALVTIGYNAFGNTKLSTFTLPSSVRSIGYACFANTKITSMNLTYVTSLGNGLFTNVTTLTSVTLPANMVRVPPNMFYGCTALRQVILPATVVEIGGTPPPSRDLQEVGDVRDIPAGAFQNSGITSIFIPSSVNNIGGNAFKGCIFLTAVTFETPGNVSYIGNGAFENCYRLPSFAWPPNVTTIPVGCFYLCAALASFTVPPAVTAVGTAAFRSCTHLTSIVWQDQSALTSVGTNVFLNSSPMTVYYLNTQRYEDLSTASKLLHAQYPSGSVFVYDGVPCFNHGTKILCWNPDCQKEEYLAVEALVEGETMVQSYLHGPRKIQKLYRGTFRNCPDDVKRCMYVMRQHANAKEDLITEDLYVTGLHSLMVDAKDILPEEAERQKKAWRSKLRGFDDKALLMACASRHFEPVPDVGKEFTYYHLTLENDGDDKRRFGVYANGLLMETPSVHDMRYFMPQQEQPSP